MKALDLFCGCGGMSHGLKAAGIDVLWANEKWEAAASTYALSHPNTKLFKCDAYEFITQIKDGGKDLPSKKDVDLIVGGPPCQGFSGWNRFRNFNDARNSLVDLFIEYIEYFTPKYVIMENVTGILSLEGGRAAKSILDAYNSMGYSYKLCILQAGSFGLPQNRWRVFFLAVKGDHEIPMPSPTYEFPRTAPFNTTSFRESVVRPTPPDKNDLSFLKKYINVRDAISDLPEISNGEKYVGDYISPPLNEYQRGIRNKSTTLFNHETAKLGPAYMSRIEALPSGSGASWVDLPNSLQPSNLKKGGKSYDNRFGRLKWGGIFNTIVSKPEPYWGRYIHPTQNRVISVRESARAQGIPDFFNFQGQLKEQYLQVGNAVPPPLAYTLGKIISSI